MQLKQHPGSPDLQRLVPAAMTRAKTWATKMQTEDKNAPPQTCIKVPGKTSL